MNICWNHYIVYLMFWRMIKQWIYKIECVWVWCEGYSITLAWYIIYVIVCWHSEFTWSSMCVKGGILRILVAQTNVWYICFHCMPNLWMSRTKSVCVRRLFDLFVKIMKYLLFWTLWRWIYRNKYVFILSSDNLLIYFQSQTKYSNHYSSDNLVIYF